MMYITFKGVRYEIPYDKDTLKLNRTIDSTFDSGYVVSVPLEANMTLDLSRRIPRNLLVEIEYDGRTFEFKTGETAVDKLTYASPFKYVHRINLVSLTKDLTRKTLENMTLKQPKGDLGIYSRSVNTIPETLTMTTGTYVLNLQNVVNTNLSKINGLSIGSLEEYRITADFTVTYLEDVNVNDEIDVNIKYGTTSIKQDVIDIPKAPFQLFPSGREFTVKKTITFNYTPTATNSLSVELTKDSGAYFFYVELASLSITSLEVASKPVRTYAQLIDKMLRNTEYVLSPSSRSRLFLTAPENKYEGYMLFDALQKIGGEVGALVRITEPINKRYWQVISPTTADFVGDSLYDFSPYDYDTNTTLQVGNKYYRNATSTDIYRQVNFEFFDNPQTFSVVGEINRTEVAELEDYVSALELNTKNVIKPIRYSPSKNGCGTLRNIDGIGQMTTSNIGYQTEDKQERITKVLVKGYASQSTSYTIPTTEVTDITERVLQDKQYNTLLSQADYSLVGKSQLMKNNTLYYVQGDDKIYGMSYFGETEDRIIGQANVTRALYETILAQRTQDYGELMTGVGNDDPGLSGDLLIEMQITYENQTESRARVYKKDQSGFETELIKYMNESANVNDTTAIGNYAQELVNRMGGTKLIINGVVNSLDDVPNLGDVDENGRVYTVINLEFGTRITYTYTLVQDYNVISSYIGVNSRHRVEEISSDSSTRRTLRYTSKVIFKNELETFSTRLVNPNNLFTHLLGNSLVGLNYGYIEYYHANGDTRRIHLSIDTDSKGQTMEIKWSMVNNYSAGLKRYSFVSGANTVYMNTEVPYTDYYGKVADILFSIYDDANHTYDKSLYPEATVSDGSNLFTIITDAIDKDEGEALSGLIEIPIFSENDKIRVYNGFSKFNAIMGGTNRLQAVALNYVPLIKDNKIDLSRVNQITVTGTMEFGEITINTTLSSASKGIAWYNIDTLDIVLCYIEDLPIGANEIKMPYIIEDSLYGGGENVTQRFISHYDIIGNMLTSSVYGSYSIGGEINISDDVVIGQDENDTLETKAYIDGDLLANSITTSYDIDGFIGQTISLVIGQDEMVMIDNTANVVGQIQYTYIPSVSFLGSISSDIDTDIAQDEYVQLDVESNIVLTIIPGANNNSYVLSGQVGSEVTKTTAYDDSYWDLAPSTAYSDTVSINTGSLNSTAVTVALTSAHPPINYALGMIMRVRVYSLDGTTLLGTTYRERKTY